MEKNKTDSYGVIPFVGLGGTYEAATKLNDNLIGFISAGMDYTLGTDPVTTNPMPVFSANTTAGVRYKIGEHVQLGGGLKGSYNATSDVSYNDVAVVAQGRFLTDSKIFVQPEASKSLIDKDGYGLKISAGKTF